MNTRFSTPAWFGDLLDVSDVLAVKGRAEVVSWRGGTEPTDADADDVPTLTTSPAPSAEASPTSSATRDSSTAASPKPA